MSSLLGLLPHLPRETRHFRRWLAFRGVTLVSPQRIRATPSKVCNGSRFWAWIWTNRRIFPHFCCNRIGQTSFRQLRSSTRLQFCWGTSGSWRPCWRGLRRSSGLVPSRLRTFRTGTLRLRRRSGGGRRRHTQTHRSQRPPALRSRCSWGFWRLSPWMFGRPMQFFQRLGVCYRRRVFRTCPGGSWSGRRWSRTRVRVSLGEESYFPCRSYIIEFK